jgi:hypothetical protein
MYVHEKSFDTHDFQFGCVFKNVFHEYGMSDVSVRFFVFSRAQQPTARTFGFLASRTSPGPAAAVKLNN